MKRRSHPFEHDRPVVLVTGSGAKRVGNSVLRRFAERGYRCAIHANRHLAEAEATVKEFHSLGVEAIALPADLREEEQVRRMFETLVDRFGRLDVLVNAAAIWEPKPLELTEADDVRRHFEINTLATFLTSREAGTIMTSQTSGGAIINIGDWAVARPYLNYAAYFCSKGSIPTITRAFAVELAARNPRVRVNAVLPGPVMLPPELSDEERRQAIAGTLVKREGTPEHVADAVVFLAENDFITGVCLPVDGGRTIASEENHGHSSFTP